MSRVGKKPIPVPDSVEINMDGSHVVVKGPKGELSLDLTGPISIKREDGMVFVERHDDSDRARSLHGLYRSLLNNMVKGVTEGFSKTLEIVGVGYRAVKNGDKLEIAVGYSKPVVVQQPEGITFEVPNPNTIVVKGIDKQKVGQVAADIRAIRKPEPYKGKGIRYQGEVIRRKAGKAGKAGGK